jgi:hypothetical protein
LRCHRPGARLNADDTQATWPLVPVGLLANWQVADVNRILLTSVMK